jgi:hypothetical protein
MLIVDPRFTTIALPEAAIGAPHVVPQHHEETASLTCPGSLYAAGGRTAIRSRATSVSTGST